MAERDAYTGITQRLILGDEVEGEVEIVEIAGRRSSVNGKIYAYDVTVFVHRQREIPKRIDVTVRRLSEWYIAEAVRLVLDREDEEVRSQQEMERFKGRRFRLGCGS